MRPAVRTFTSPGLPHIVLRTGLGLAFPPTSKSRTWGLPAAAKKCLSGVICRQFTFGRRVYCACVCGNCVGGGGGGGERRAHQACSSSSSAHTHL